MSQLPSKGAVDVVLPAAVNIANDLLEFSQSPGRQDKSAAIGRTRFLPLSSLGCSFPRRSHLRWLQAGMVTCKILVGLGAMHFFPFLLLVELGLTSILLSSLLFCVSFLFLAPLVIQ